MTVLVPAQDASPADWIVESLTVFGLTVTGLVPAGFEAYVRVFHPAIRDGAPLRWTQIAEEQGRVAHGGMQLGGITGHIRYEYNGDKEVWDHPPAVGTMTLEIARVLADLLGAQTGTPDRCWFALWNGFGDSRDRLQGSPTFVIPARSYFVLTGRVQDVTESLGERRYQSANLWWPDDHAWCVATEIDLKSTYVGCSAACADVLLAQAELEAYAIEPTLSITWTSDTLNPTPERS